MTEMETMLIKMEYIKQEGECCCCFSKDVLFNISEPHNFEEDVEIYSNMIAECFQIDLSSYIEDSNRNIYLICKNCIFRLRDAIMLRSQVWSVYNRLQAEYCKKHNQDGNMEAKENIPKYNDTRIDLNASFSNEDVLKLKPLNQKDCKNDAQSESVCCEYCNKSFGSRKKLQQHIRIHSTRKVWSCDVCGKTLSSKRSFKDHVLIHSGEKNQKCELCTKAFLTRRTLVNHMRMHLPKKFICKYCNKAFQCNSNLLQHEKIHLNIKDLICDFCKRPFRSKASLREHILLHMGIKNIKCDLCNKCFVSRLTLGSHKRSCHSVSLPCNVCGQHYKNKALLAQHMLVHTQVKKFVCENCGRTFKSKNNIRTHILKHCRCFKIIVQNSF